jgi:hypothetical protein
MEFLGSQVIAFLPGRVLPVLLGGLGGFLYYRFIGCKTGGCPLTGNPWIITLYGAMIGYLVVSQ